LIIKRLSIAHRPSITIRHDISAEIRRWL